MSPWRLDRCNLHHSKGLCLEARRSSQTSNVLSFMSVNLKSYKWRTTSSKDKKLLFLLVPAHLQHEQILRLLTLVNSVDDVTLLCDSFVQTTAVQTLQGFLRTWLRWAITVQSPPGDWTDSLLAKGGGLGLAAPLSVGVLCPFNHCD